MRVILLKLALAVAVSFTGFFYSTYGRTRRIIIDLPSPLPSEEDCKEADLNLSEKINGCSCSSVEGNSEDGFLLPEFLDLINEFESSYNEVYPAIPEAYDDDDEVEFGRPKSTADIELLEYYGLKEMEAAFTELQNRLRASERENLRLVSQAAAHTKASAELESAMEEIESLKRSIRSCEEENSDLAKRMLSSQSPPSSTCDASETGGDNGEDRKLVEENERLVKEVERLVRDRRGDAEELVYLRWLNACFRYELREYKPRSGKTAAKELSKARSPRSEAKVKQLIFQYSKSYPSIDFDSDFDFDFDFSPSSQPSSILTDSDEPSIRPSFSAATRTLSTRPKLFAGLRSLLRGRQRSIENRPKR